MTLVSEDTDKGEDCIDDDYNENNKGDEEPRATRFTGAIRARSPQGHQDFQGQRDHKGHRGHLI